MYIECNMGASGDMILSALSELAGNQEGFISELNGLGIPGIRAKLYNTQNCGVNGTSIGIKVNGHDTASGYSQHRPHGVYRLRTIKNMIATMSASTDIKRNVSEIYEKIAAAKGAFQGKPTESVYLHELGRGDSLADITGVCMLMNKLAPDKVIVSPVCTGKGTVDTLRGRLEVPTPLTKELLKGVPSYSGKLESELCTPTGAALLSYFADEFGEMPDIKLRKCGIGIGKKIFNVANCVRIYMGYSGEQTATIKGSTEGMQTVTELKANIDDMTPEMLSYAQEVLHENGALEVYTVPIFMKKNRSAVMLCCICKDEDAMDLAALMLKHTTTRGVRSQSMERYTLDAVITKYNTKYGIVSVKTSTGYGIEKQKIEYEDLARIARETGRTIKSLSEELTRELDL
ncbi:MAG: nickel pincer cofactor biosynthesis protein LarC [Clostridiales bacterium]|nr:nickel pincer cofactor biosynthesis protein LarC [Clostridiales bacterium]